MKVKRQVMGYRGKSRRKRRTKSNVRLYKGSVKADI